MLASSKRVIGAALAGASIAGLALVWHRPESIRGEARAQARPGSPPVVTVAPPTARRIVETREFAGRFEPSAGVEIRARATGHLQSIGFSDGDLVRAGQLLFTIDQAPYRAALDEARARLASALAQIELAELELKRAEQLIVANAASQAQLDQRRQQQRAAAAGRALAEAAVERAKIELDFTEVRAPFTGRISNRRLDPGALVGEGAMLTTLVAVDPIYFVFDISEQDMLAYQTAAAGGGLPVLNGSAIPVEVQTQRGGEWLAGGVIDFLDNRVEPGAGTIRARARIDHAGGRITPGQFGRLRLPFSRSYDALLVPETALLTDQNRRIILTVAQDGTVRPARVELGPRQQDGLRVVRRGVAADDRVVVGGLLRARPGQRVTARPAEPAARAAELGAASGTGG